MKKVLVEKLKNLGVVRTGHITLKNAGDSSIYIDIKKAFGYPEILRILCILMKKNIPDGVGCIATSGYGGIPLAGALAVKYKLKLVLIREKPKTHGRNVLIDGYIPQKNERVWIIDDVFTTGGSIRQMVKVLRKTGAKIDGCSVVLKRTNKPPAIKCDHILLMEDLI